MISLVEFRYLTSVQPEGYVYAPLFGQQKEAVLQVCALLKKDPDSVGGALVLLRDHLDAKVYLGCVIDKEGRIHQWVEIWVQTVAGLLGTPASYREALSNAILDERWSRFADALTALGVDAILRTGWETRHPAPLFVRLPTGDQVFPAVSPGGPWQLCQDDALLERNGLPPYRSSLHRYLHAASADGSPSFAPVTPESPTNALTVSLAQVCNNESGLVPLNPEGGLLTVRPYYPLSFDEHLTVLGGGTWKGTGHGRTPLDPCQAGRELGHPDNPGRIFLGARGVGGQLLETLHLKACALAETFRVTRDLIAKLQRPLLHLCSDAFRVQFSDVGTSLPYLWTARVALTDGGEAVALPIQSSDTRYYLRGRSQTPSIYLPEAVVVFSRGRCGIRIRQMFSDVRKGLIVEGTFQTRDDLAVHTHDLVWFRVNLPSGAVDLYARLEEDRALAYGEWRFRTIGQKLENAFIEGLKAAEGVPLHNTPYEVLPLLSSPCDLYSLAVLAIKTLMVNEDNSLPMAIDEVLSLARESAVGDVKEEGLPRKILELFEKDTRWGESIGPQRLVSKRLSCAEAFSVVPATLWWEALAMVVRMFPGLTRFSTCRDLGDASPRALHEVLNRCIQDADALVRQTRNLIVSNCAENQEIRQVLSAYRLKGK